MADDTSSQIERDIEAQELTLAKLPALARLIDEVRDDIQLAQAGGRAQRVQTLLARLHTLENDYERLQSTASAALAEEEAMRTRVLRQLPTWQTKGPP